MAFGRQLRALLSKNLTLKKRLWKQTIWEFLIPIAYCYVLSLMGIGG
jgi:hypothetical protein